MNLNHVLGTAIAKGAASATRKPMAALRRDVADLKRQVAELKRLLRAMRSAVQEQAARSPAPEAEAAQPSRIRPTGPMVLRLRKRLGLTQVELAKLLCVSSLTVSKWESAQGRIRLRSRTLESLAKIRGISRQEAKGMLAG